MSVRHICIPWTSIYHFGINFPKDIAGGIVPFDGPFPQDWFYWEYKKPNVGAWKQTNSNNRIWLPMYELSYDDYINFINEIESSVAGGNSAVVLYRNCGVVFGPNNFSYGSIELGAVISKSSLDELGKDDTNENGWESFLKMVDSYKNGDKLK